MQTRDINGLRKSRRDNLIEPIVRMSCTMHLELNRSNLTFRLGAFDSGSEHRTRAADDVTQDAADIMKALDVVGPQSVANGFAPNVVGQLTNAATAWTHACNDRRPFLVHAPPPRRT